MKDSGYYGIGIELGKSEPNYWTLFRTAQIFDAAFLFVIGKRFRVGAPDTMKSWRHMPVYSYTDFADFNAHRPHDCELVGIEISDEAAPINTFQHPKRAIYLLGAEDNGLTNAAISKCQKLVVLPGKRCLNVAVAGSIVLYDRLSKKHERQPTTTEGGGE